MSTHSNPFAPWMCQFQSISSLGHNSHSASPGHDNRNRSPYTSYAEPPSILGVLPMSTSNSHSHSHSYSPFSHSSSTSQHVFEFTNLNPTILNSIVTATSATRPAFRISTDKGGGVAGYTTVKDGEGRGIALVEWAGSAVPSVEIRGVLPKVKARDWLKVTVEPSLGRPVRVMFVKGVRFIWVPRDQQLHLYSQTPNSPPCAVVEKSRHAIKLLMTAEGLSWGLWEPCIVAVTLLLSGRRLE
ncbi:hypothetical protein BD410DRAFT_816845 [Rickenella mellea]|uniref:DUF6593 domain-containing protein n=1 Tax=Rickenella mellea TaxID=50990 RepID=A0A4Y7PKK4_9AGAM|nr:hypothetical protein BD410DRAFT_816845 [Rickenella mellea]